MTLQEAIKILTKKFPNRKIIAAYEYDSVFVFSLVSKNSKIDTDEGLFDCQTSVDKKTGEILTFQPWNISANEYKQGKKVM